MKFSQHTIDSVQEVDAVQLAHDLDFQGIKRQGARHVALCPWHDDTHPSCCIGGPGSYAHVVKCFVCHESTASNIDLVMKLKHLPFRDAVLWIATQYGLDTRCHTLFPSIDRQGRVHNVKLQVYDINRQSPRYGHSQATYWVGQRLLLRDDGTEYDRDTDCLFGEHLLDLRPSAVVGLVESPKNAIVCACQWPHLVWVAVGNKGMLKRPLLTPLAGRHVLVFPDLDAVDEWSATLSTMQDLANFYLSSFAHTPRTPHNQKMDIADYILM